MPAKGMRKCKGCKEMFIPDPRTRDRQRYCSKPDCKRASKADRQRRWLQMEENRKYFSGPENVARVQAWRKANPGYSKRKTYKAKALQDDSAAEVPDSKEDKHDCILHALQDNLTPQDVVLVGFISSFIGSALQDDIAVAMRRAHTCGLQILGIGPGTQNGAVRHEERKKNYLSGTGSSNSPSIQLGGPASGP